MLSLQNLGLIPIEGITTMGVNVKDGPSIGLFGTGLKYAISVVLRLGGTITIYRGREPYRFSTETKEIRGKNFEIVHMNGQPLGFTTEYGKTWEPWMAFRELYSNMLDEHGTHSHEPQPAAEGVTTLHVDCGPITDAYANRHEYFIEGTPIYLSPELLEVHPGPSEFIYYRGIQAGRLAKPSVLKYNILTETTLTEDRNLQPYYIGWRIVRGLERCTDQHIFDEILLCGEDYFEYSLDWTEVTTPSENFLAAFEASWEKNPAKPNRSATELLVRRRPHIREKGYRSPTFEQMQMINTAYAFCEFFDENARRWPIAVADDLGENVLALARFDKIILTERIFKMGQDEVNHGVLEEHLHLHYGFIDCSRGLQNFLFGLLSKAHR